jgi:hypothetical protein
LDRIMEGLMDSSMKPASAATFSTSRVLPVPGGPYSRKVRAGWRMPLNLRVAQGGTAATKIWRCQQPTLAGLLAVVRGMPHAHGGHALAGGSCGMRAGSSMAAACSNQHSQVRVLQRLKHSLLQLKLDIPACITGHPTHRTAQRSMPDTSCWTAVWQLMGRAGHACRMHASTVEVCWTRSMQGLPSLPCAAVVHPEQARTHSRPTTSSRDPDTAL